MMTLMSSNLNMKRVFLVALSVLSLIFLVVVNGMFSNQRILLNAQRGISMTPLECYNSGVNSGLKLSYDEYIMVCSVVQGETAGADLYWSELVAEVIKNRVLSKNFPNTIFEVLTQPNQFDAIQNYYDCIDINAVTYQAVMNVFSNKDYLTSHHLDGATYYCNPDILDTSTADWFNNNLTLTYDAYYYSNGCEYHHKFYK